MASDHMAGATGRQSDAALAARAARVAKKAAAKAKKIAAQAARDQAVIDKAAAKAACALRTIKPPPEYQQWGFIRTSIWVKAAAVCRRMVNGSPSLNKLNAGLAALTDAETLPVEQLVEQRLRQQ